MAKRKAIRRKGAKRAKKAEVEEQAKPMIGPANLKFAIAILIFGAITAWGAISNQRDITLLFGLVTAAAALTMAVKSK